MSLTQRTKPKRSHIFMMKVILIVVVLIFVGIIGANFLKKIKTAEALANMPEYSSPVTAMTIQPQSWTPVINSTGLVRPNQGAMLSIQSSGTVSKILIENGQSVKKGDVLLELDSAVEKANLQAAKAQLPYLSQTYQRYVNLVKSNAASKSDLDSAKAAYDAQVASIKALESTIDRMKIVAPFDGKAGIVQVNVGSYVTAGTEIVRVEDRSSMKVDFSISQNNIEKIHIGQNITATSDALSGQVFKAKVSSIDPAVNKSTGLVQVQATFEPENSSKLMSGMFTRLSIDLPTEENQVVVPQVAITYNIYGEVAYLLEPLSAEEKEKFADYNNVDKLYRAKQIIVFTKDRQGIYAQLTGDDVKIGDSIITGGQQSISKGSLVEVVDKQAVGTVTPSTITNL